MMPPSTCEMHETFQAGPELLIRLRNDTNLFHLIMGSLRGIAGAAVIRVIELELFPPMTTENDNFHLLSLQFEGLGWVIASMPARTRPKVEQVVTEMGWRFADGIPHVVDARRVSRFPFDCDRAFTLEPRKDSICYSGAEAREQMERLATARMKDAERKHGAWFNAQASASWRGRTWHKLPAGMMPPANTIDAVRLGDQSGQPAIWWTADPRNDNWRSYPT